MDNAAALQRFEQSLRRRFPDRITPGAYGDPIAERTRFQRGATGPVESNPFAQGSA